MHTNANKVSEDGSLKVYEVAEKIVKPIWKVKRKNFIITLNRTLGDFKCSYRLFEFRGILYKHVIRVIEIEEVDWILGRNIFWIDGERI